MTSLPSLPVDTLLSTPTPFPQHWAASAEGHNDGITCAPPPHMRLLTYTHVTCMCMGHAWSLTHVRTPCVYSPRPPPPPPPMRLSLHSWPQPWPAAALTPTIHHPCTCHTLTFAVCTPTPPARFALHSRLQPWPAATLPPPQPPL
jgi:hypothetical protein